MVGRKKLFWYNVYLFTTFLWIEKLKYENTVIIFTLTIAAHEIVQDKRHAF